jgi:hypothetical protein
MNAASYIAWACLVGALALVPVSFILVTRFIKRRKSLDVFALKRFKKKCVTFLVLCFIASGTLAAFHGSLAVPAFWALTAVILTLFLSLHVLKK